MSVDESYSGAKLHPADQEIIRLRARVAELEAEVEYLRNNHKESCLWPSTIIESDQKMADGRPRKMAAVPNWCIHKIETYARKKK